MPASLPLPVRGALLALLALAPAGAGAFAAAPDRKVAADLIAPIAPADLLEGRVKEAWIWRHDILLTAEGEARIQDPVALRDREFKDALGRKSLAIAAATLPGSTDPVLVAHLPPPAGPADQWFLRARAATPAAVRVLQVRFRFRGRVLDRIPEEFHLRPAGSVADLTTEDTRPRWISVADLVADGESLHARYTAPVFAAAFSDECGAAARIRRTKTGLDLISDEVTWGWILPAPQSLKEHSSFGPIASWTEGGRTSPAVPARLRRTWWNGRTTGRNWGVNALPGETTWASAGEIYVYRRGERKEVRICVFPWARASKEPFSDQFGEAYAFHVPTYDKDMGRWSWTSNTPWLVAEWPAFINAGADVDAFPQVPRK